MPPQRIPTYKSPEKRRRSSAYRETPKIEDKIKFGDFKPSPKKGDKPTRPSAKTEDRHKTSPKEELKRGVAKGLASASAGLSGRGTAGRILKAGLAGAAGGAEIAASYQRYKDKRSKKRGKDATTTVTQSAMAQKAKFHKKDPTSTERT